MLTRFLLLLLCFAWASPAWAQVATPSIDPGQPVQMAAASSWRMGSSIGLGTSYGRQTTSAGRYGDRAFGSQGLLVFQPTHVTTEIFGVSNDDQAQWDATSDLLYPYQHQEQRIGLSVRGDGRVSVGLGGLSRGWTSRGIERSQKGLSGSFGVRVGEGMFLATGVNRVTETVDGLEDKQWNETLAGWGFVYGSPESNMFRLEVSQFTTPEVIGGTTLAEINHRQVQQVGDLEILLSQYLFTAKGTLTKTTAVLAGEADRELFEKRFGLGYRSWGFSSMLYQVRAVQLEADKRHEVLYYKLTLGVGFM